MEGETILVETGPTFNVVHSALRELEYQNRLFVIHHQTATLTDIESNDAQEERRFMFGGQFARTRGPLNFGQTASAVVRMCMLEAVGVPRTVWPHIGEHSDSRNKAKLQREVIQGQLFQLANDQTAARHYWWRYDQLYPHFRIAHGVQSHGFNVRASFPGMMIIFRNYFRQVIEITTEFSAERAEDNQFRSNVLVTCIVRNIGKGKDGPHTRFLKMLMLHCDIPVKYFKALKVKSEEDEDDENSKEDNEEDNGEDHERDNGEDHEKDNGEDHEKDNTENSTQNSKKNEN